MNCNRMKKNKPLSQSLITLFTFLIIPLLAFAQSAPIAIDDDFSDWTSNLATFSDANDISSGLDFFELQVTNDEDFLYLKIKVSNEIDLTDNLEPSHDVVLYIDTDNNSNTGHVPQEDYGAELIVNLEGRTARFEGTTIVQNIDLEDVMLRHAPTVTSDEFEIAINRHVAPVSNIPLFEDATIKILFRNPQSGDAMPDEGETFSYTFDETPVPEYVPIDLHKSSADYVRIVAWNTENDGLEEFDRRDNFENILSVLQPDIIAFSEASDTEVSTVKSMLDNLLETENPAGWFVAKDDYDMITASRWNFIDTWPELDRQFPTLIDLPDHYAKDLLLNSGHYNCCSNDEGRQDQADQYIAFLKDAKTPGGDIDLEENTPFLLVGDLNLVGYAQQLNTLIAGDIQNTLAYGVPAAPDWDDTDCTDQICMQTDQRMAYTWRNDFSSYPPGRLDFQIYSDAAMTAMKSYTLQTGIMSTTRLQEYGLNAWDAEVASDHFPVVVDYQIPMTTAIAETGKDTEVQLWTAREEQGFYVKGMTSDANVSVYGMSGKYIVVNKNLSATNGFISSAGWVSGVYLFAVEKAGKVTILKGVCGH